MNKKLLSWMLVLGMVLGAGIAEAAFYDAALSAPWLKWIFNAAVITAVVYFILLLVKFEMQGNTKWFMLAVIALFAFMVSKNVIGDVWIWSAEGLFGDIRTILFDYTRWTIFIAAGVLFFWLFEHIGVGGDKYGSKLNGAISIIIAYSLALNKMDTGSLVTIGEIIALYIIYSNVKGKLGNGYLEFFGTLFLVWFISDTAFKGMGWLGGIFGTAGTMTVIIVQLALMCILMYLINSHVLNHLDFVGESSIAKLGKYIVSAGVAGGIIYFSSSYWESLFGFSHPGLFSSVAGKKLWAIAALGVVLLFWAGKTFLKKKGEGGAVNDFLKNFKDKGVELAFSKAQEANIPAVNSLIKGFDIRGGAVGKGTAKEEWGLRVESIWGEFWILMNYMLRLEVFGGKIGFVKGTRDSVQTLYSDDEESEEAVKPKTLKYFHPSTLNANIDLYRTGNGFSIKGGGKSIDHDTRHYFSVDNKGNIDTQKEMNDHWGCDNDELGLFYMLTFLKEDVDNESGTQLTGESDSQKGQKEAISDALFGPKKGRMDAALAPIWGDSGSDTKKFDSYSTRRGLLNEIKAHRLVALNQFLMYGTYVHYHKYARPGARLFRKRAIPKSGTGSVPSYPEYSLDKEKMLEDSGWEEVGIVGEEKGSKLTVKDLTDFEVDWDGFSMKDLNTYQFDGGDVYIHRVKPIDHISNPDGSREPLLIDNVVDHPNMLIPLNSQVTAWEYFIRDIRTGMFHPKSRTLQDYAQKHARREPYRTDVVQSFGAPTEGGNPAFDMEALKDPGGFKYWGLKNANTISEDQMKNASPINPYPTLSIQGLSSYIGDYLFNLADTAQREQAKNFVFDRGGRGNMFTRDIEKKKE